MRKSLFLFSFFFPFFAWAQMSHSDSLALSDELFAEGVTLYQAKDYRKAAKKFEQLRIVDEQLYDSLDEAYGYARGWLARCYHLMGHTDKAIPLSSAFELEPADRRPRVKVDSLATVAVRLFDKGDIDGALALMPEVERMELELEGSLGGNYLSTLAYHANLLLKKGEAGEAEKLFRQAGEGFESTVGADNYMWASVMRSLPFSLSVQGKNEEALALARRLEAVYEKYGDCQSDGYLNALYDVMSLLVGMDESEGMEQTRLSAQRLKQRCEEARKTDIEVYPIAVGILGEIAYIRGDAEQAEQAFLRADELYDALKDTNSDNFWHIRFLSLLSKMYAVKGNYAEAKQFADKGLDLCKGPYRSTVLYSQLLMTKGASAINLGDKYRGLTWIDQSIDKYRELGEIDETLIEGLSVMSMYYRSVNNHQKDVEYSRQLIDTYQRIPGIQDTLVVSAMFNLAQSYLAYGEIDSARVMTVRALDEAEHRLAGQVYLGAAYEYAAKLMALVPNLDAALDYARRGVAVFEQYHYDVYLHNALAILASVYSAREDYALAEENQQRVVAYMRRTYGEESVEFYQAATTLAQYQSSLGNFADAQQLLQQAQAGFDAYHTKEHTDTPLALDDVEERIQLGLEFLQRGELDEAAVAFTQATHMLERDSLTETVLYANAMTGLGMVAGRQQQWDSALAFTESAIGHLEKTLGHDKAMLNNYYLYFLHGQYLCITGKTTEGFDLLAEVERFVANRLSEDNMLYLQAAWSVCSAAWLDNRTDVACDYTLRLSALLREYILSKFTTMTAAERMSLWLQNSAFYEKVIPYMTNRFKDNPQVAEPLADCAYDGQLLAKGLLLTTEIEMNRILLESGDQQALEAYNELKRLRSRLDQLTAVPLAQRTMDADSLRREVNRQERQLMTLSTAYGDYTRPLRTTWQQVRDALSPGDVAIEFVTFLPDSAIYPFQQKYAALVLKKGMKHPQLVNLCVEAQLQVISADGYYTTDSLAQVIWQPLAPYLNDARRVFFSPVGLLHNIAIEYAPLQGGSSFAERYDTYRLSSTREVVTAHAVKRMESARLFGGLQYNAKMEEVSEANREAGLDADAPLMASRAPVDSLLVRGGAGYLAYTLQEVEEIARELHGKVKDVRALVGVQGTEEAFKSLSGHPSDILHVATHGFFWTEEEANRLGNLTFLANMNMQSSSEEDKALSRSGLLFAGANATLTHKQVPDNMEDGILTARELSQMDLRGISLVVLSACQTALGTITGDGVFGLQRGFKKAGAGTIVMSLWKVDDQATQILMSAFYHHLAEGDSARSAFRKAQSHLRQVEDGRFDKPVYWAAFILLDAVEN